MILAERRKQHLDTSGNWRAGTNYDSLTRVVGGFWDARAAGFLGR